MTDQTESAYAELIGRLKDPSEHGGSWIDTQDAILAIRALEAKVRELREAIAYADHVVQHIRADRDRLAGEVERLTKERDLACGEIDAAWVERDSLRRDLETCKVDAERYRWLRERGTYESWRLNTPLGPMERLERLDAAIDLARARGEGNADE